MIYTVTFNPSIDLKMELPGFCEGAVNRSVREWLCAGGKGINVSCVLARLGIASKALALVAGFLAGLVSGLAEGDALRLGAAAGSATAFSENLAEKEDILALYNNAENRIK